MPVITIEEHWTLPAIDAAQEALPADRRDPSLVFNDRGDLLARLHDIGQGRVAAMDAAGIDMQILSLTPPGTGGLEAADAVALSREANDRVAAAVDLHPQRFRALSSLPTSDPAAAVVELERTAAMTAHVGVMTYGRSGDRPLDDPAFDDLWAAAERLGQPVFIHPQIPVLAVRAASYSGLDPIVDLSLASFGWGWHLEAGLAALRLILRGTFDRHPNLQIVLGHWGEMALFALDRADSLSNVAGHLDRRVAEYFADNVHIATSGMLYPRMLRAALDFTTTDRILLSGDYPFHQLDASAIDTFLGGLADDAQRDQVAWRDATELFRL